MYLTTIRERMRPVLCVQIVLYHQQTLLKTLVRVLSNKCLGLLFRASSMLKSSRLQEKIIYVIYIRLTEAGTFVSLDLLKRQQSYDC